MRKFKLRDHVLNLRTQLISYCVFSFICSLASRVDDIEISLGQIIEKIDGVFKNIDKEERENIRKREAMDTIFSGEGKSCLLYTSDAADE